VNGDEYIWCPTCGGTGAIEYVDWAGRIQRCPDCDPNLTDGSGHTVVLVESVFS
jgi:hypothetical protein